MSEHYVTLKHPYIRIRNESAASFGGSQQWFPGRTLQGYGCGLIGAVDLILYLTGSRNRQIRRSPLTTGEYLTYANRLRQRYFPILPRLGINGFSLAWGIRRALRKAGFPCLVRWGAGQRDFLPVIARMLSDDIPVLLSAGPNFPVLWGKDGVPLYRKGAGKTFAKTQEIRSHYVVITGMKGNMLQVSSWGKEYYIRWEEYQDYIEKHSCRLFSNICSITFPASSVTGYDIGL